VFITTSMALKQEKITEKIKMTQWKSIETPPSEAGVYEYKMANGYEMEIHFDGEFRTAAGDYHRLMPGDQWRPVQPKLLTVFQQIWATSKKIHDGRNKYKVLAKANEEIGELSEEIMIAEGDHYKEPGKDGVIGEAVDVIICMGDMIFQEDPNITEEQVLAIISKKLNKWVEKNNERTNNRDVSV